MNKLFVALKESRGFSPARVVLTLLYVFSVFYGAILFPLSIGNYFVQAIALIMFGGGLWLALKSLKKMFDRRMREKISRIAGKISKRISKFFSKWLGIIAKKLGIERKRVRGEDERDFIFHKREGSRRRRNKMKNPHPWNDADNATRVRYIFTEFMFRKIREGYRIAPKYTPQKWNETSPRKTSSTPSLQPTPMPATRAENAKSPMKSSKSSMNWWRRRGRRKDKITPDASFSDVSGVFIIYKACI